jgi:hypothetical protein
MKLFPDSSAHPVLRRLKIADLNAEAAARHATEHLGFVVSGGAVGVDERRSQPPLSSSSQRWCITVPLMRRKVDTMLWVTSP